MTRSGSNKFHGTLFEYLRNDIFDARNYFDAPPLPKPPLRQNDFGGTFAGPIRKDRAFFFFTYEGLRLRLPMTAKGNFYTVAARANVAPVFQPLLPALPIPNGAVNSDGITAPLSMAYSDPTSLDSGSPSLRKILGNPSTPTLSIQAYIFAICPKRQLPSFRNLSIVYLNSCRDGKEA